MPLAELISYGITIFGLVIIITLVAARGLKNPVNRTFVLFASNIMLYILASFSTELIKSLDHALWFSRMALFFADFVPLTFYLFAAAFTQYKPLESKYKRMRTALYIITPLIALTAISPLAIGNVARGSYGTTINHVGPLLWVTLIFLVAIFIMCFRMFVSYGKTADVKTRLQLRIMSYGIGADLFLSLLTLVVLPELHVLYLGNVIGVPANILFVGGVGYAILRHKMFDIRVAIFKTLGYLITIVGILLIYSGTLVGISGFIFPFLNLTVAEDVYFVITSIILAISFRPLVNLIGRITEGVFFRDQYDPQVLLNKIGHVLASEIRLHEVSAGICTLLSETLHAQTDIVILDKGHIYFESGNYFDTSQKDFETDLSRLGNGVVIMDDLPEGQQKAIMRKYGLSVFVPLKTHSESIGYLLFSDKASGASYTKFDIRTIQNIANELSIGFQNSRSFALVQSLNQTLQNKIDEAKKGLEEANKKLKESDQVKDDFISMASHQLSTPLAVIDGYLTLANQGVYGKLNDKLSNAISAAGERAQVMKSLLVDLLDISRMTAGKFMLQIEPGDINKVVKREFDQLNDLAMEKSVDYNFHPPKEPISSINLDSQKTGQAVMNLIHNALHYAAGKKVDVYLDSDDNNVIFKVIDNGIGVPDEQKAKLFTKFYRATNAKKERPNGTGIGLYLVKRVVEDQGGKIIFESKVNNGSTFGFTLPKKMNKTSTE